MCVCTFDCVFLSVCVLFGLDRSQRGNCGFMFGSTETTNADAADVKPVCLCQIDLIRVGCESLWSKSSKTRGKYDGIVRIFQLVSNDVLRFLKINESFSMLQTELGGFQVDLMSQKLSFLLWKLGPVHRLQ